MTRAFNVGLTATYRIQFHKGFDFRAGAAQARISARSRHFARLRFADHEIARGIDAWLRRHRLCGHQSRTWRRGGVSRTQRGAGARRHRAHRRHRAQPYGGRRRRQSLLVGLVGEGRRQRLCGFLRRRPRSARPHRQDPGSPPREVLSRGARRAANSCSSCATTASATPCSTSTIAFPFATSTSNPSAPRESRRSTRPRRLHALLEAQHYRLASWRTANDWLNYRRFFEITTLAGVRIERAEAFEQVHRVPLQLYAEGLIDGVRVDHIDGLTDPAGYCARLREAMRGVTPSGRKSAGSSLISWSRRSWPSTRSCRVGTSTARAATTS